MDWLAFAGSIIGGLIGGLFTFLGVHLTLKHDREKERKAELIKAEESKPRLEIIRHTGIEETRGTASANNDCNVLVLGIKGFVEEDGRAKFAYDKAALSSENLVFVEYELKNVGLTEIKDICVTSNLPKSVSLIELERKEFYINESLLNYDVWSNKRYLKPGDVFKLRVYYIKGQIVVSDIGSPLLTIWLDDVNGRYWSQVLSTQTNEIEISRLQNSSEFRASIDIKTAIECFKNPLMW